MSETETKINPPGKLSINFSEITGSTELLYFFVWRDLKVKYKQTYLGVLWAVLQPLLLMAIFYIVFSRTLKISVGASYPVYAFAGLTLWGLFSSGITQGSESLRSNADMIRKIYFPRLLIPLAALVTAFVDFIIAFILLLILLIIFRQPISWTAIFFFPAGIVLTLISAFGIGSLLSSLNVKYRDFRYLLPFLMQLFFFSSQIVYSIHSLGDSWFTQLLYLNPLNGALELFSAPMYGGRINITGVLTSLATGLIVLGAGLYYFRRTEVYFADYI